MSFFIWSVYAVYGYNTVIGSYRTLQCRVIFKAGLLPLTVMLMPNQIRPIARFGLLRICRMFCQLRAVAYYTPSRDLVTYFAHTLRKFYISSLRGSIFRKQTLVWGDSRRLAERMDSS